MTHLVNKGLVHEVGAANTEVEDVDLLEDCVVECIEEPRRARHLVVGDHAEDVQVCVGCKT